MRHIIFGTKSQELDLEISLHIFQICSIIKELNLHLVNTKFCVYCSIPGRRVIQKWLGASSGEIKNVMMPVCLVLSFLSLQKAVGKHCSKWWYQSKPVICSVNKCPSSLTYKKYFILSHHVPFQWNSSCLCWASPVTFQVESFFIKCCSLQSSSHATHTHFV